MDVRAVLGPEGPIARRHDLLVCSDEIHSGLVLDPEKRHLPFGHRAVSHQFRCVDGFIQKFPKQAFCYQHHKFFIRHAVLDRHSIAEKNIFRNGHVVADE